MNMFWILILVSFFATNSLDKTESVKLDEKPYKIFDEIFGEGWWDNEKEEEWNKLTLEQIGPNSTDQNPPLTETDHSDNAKNGEEENEIIKENSSYEKRKIVDKFHAIKDEFRKKGKYSAKERTQIEEKIAKHLNVNRNKIYKWKKEFGLSQKKTKNERINLVEKFDKMKAELTRDGFKKSYKEINETVAKELGLSDATIYKWKNELGQTTPQHKHSHSEQKELMKLYYEFKDKNPKFSDENIAKRLQIGSATLIRWKKQFERRLSRRRTPEGLLQWEEVAN